MQISSENLTKGNFFYFRLTTPMGICKIAEPHTRSRTVPNFTAEELTTICLNVFQKLNIPAAEAEIVTRFYGGCQSRRTRLTRRYSPRKIRTRVGSRVNPARGTNRDITRIGIYRCVRWELGFRSRDCDARRWAGDFRRRNRRMSVLLWSHGVMRWVD